MGLTSSSEEQVDPTAANHIDASTLSEQLEPENAVKCPTCHRHFTDWFDMMISADHRSCCVFAEEEISFLELWRHLRQVQFSVEDCDADSPNMLAMPIRYQQALRATAVKNQFCTMFFADREDVMITAERTRKRDLIRLVVRCTRCRFLFFLIAKEKNDTDFEFTGDAISST